MENNLQLKQVTISSIEIAEMLEIRHSDLLRKINRYFKILLNAKLRSVDYFIEDSYKDDSGKTNKCYQFTKLGCDFIANKFTDEKGIILTAKYVRRFNEMAEYIKTQNQSQSLIEYDNKIQHVEQGIEKLE